MNLKIGNNKNTVVSETPIQDQLPGASEVVHHGGYLVAASVPASLAPLFSFSFRSAEVVEAIAEHTYDAITPEDKARVFDLVARSARTLYFFAGLRDAISEARDAAVLPEAGTREDRLAEVILAAQKLLDNARAPTPENTSLGLMVPSEFGAKLEIALLRLKESR